MKVIQVSPLYFPYVGGVSTHVKLLSEGLARNGVEVEVYTFDPKRWYKRSETINGVKVKRFPAFAPSDAYYFSISLLRALREAKADIVHAHCIHDSPPLLSAVAKNTNKAFLVATFYYHRRAHTFFRNMLFQPYKFILGRYILHKIDHLICLSKHEEKMIRSDFKLSTKTIVIPACLRINNHYFNPRRTSCNSANKILFVGRLEEYKGVQYLLYAVKKLLREMDVELRVVGEGPYEKKLRKMAEKLGIVRKVIFSHKKGDEVIEEYINADVVVIPSQYESFNLVAIEALACGKPVITTLVGEGWTLVKNGLCIGLRDPKNIDEISKKIAIVLNGKCCQEEMKTVKNMVFQRYSPKKISELTLGTYETLLRKLQRVPLRNKRARRSGFWQCTYME